MNIPSQLPLDLPAGSPSYDPDSFLLSAANRQAWEIAHSWQDAKGNSLIICGPGGSGKSHLAHVVTGREAQVSFTDSSLFSGSLQKDSLLVIRGMPPGCPRLFLENYERALELCMRLVITGRGHPSDWAGGLKDLETRFGAMPRAVLHEPDELLIRHVIAKNFSDRQVHISPEVIDYAVRRLPRTFSAARRFAELADRMSLGENRKITKQLVRPLFDASCEGYVTEW